MGTQAAATTGSNYTGVDQKSGTNQNVTGSDGIGDTAVVIAQNNVDNYPLMAPYTEQPTAVTPLQLEFSIMGTIAVVSGYRNFCQFIMLKNRKQTQHKRGKRKMAQTIKKYSNVLWFVIIAVVFSLFLYWITVAVYGFGDWLFLSINIAFFAIFLAFIQFRRRIARLPASATLAFIVALYLEMYGFPLTMYLFSWAFRLR